MRKIQDVELGKGEGMSIKDMIDAGEGKSLEFKKILPASEKLAKSIIAF